MPGSTAPIRGIRPARLTTPAATGARSCLPGILEGLRILRPGGYFFIVDNCLVSGEFDFPLYGWLPDKWRYRLRVARQGPDIMNLGIDFHQFTYPLLRNVFRSLGFSRIVDRVSLADVDTIVSWWKRFLVRSARHFAFLRELVLLFAETTTFVCVK